MDVFVRVGRERRLMGSRVDHASRRKQGNGVGGTAESADSRKAPEREEELLQRQWLERLISAMNMFRLYPPEHPESARELAALAASTVSLQAYHDGEIALSQAEGAVAVNHVPMNPKVLTFRRMAEELRRRNLHTLIFSSGVDAQELSEFLRVFSDKPQRTVAAGGLGLLMEERGIRHIRLAGLQYAARAEEAGEAGEDRVLFARMEDCLMDQTSGGSAASELVAYLENPKTTARFLLRHAGAADPDPTFAREVVETLEKAGTLVYTRQPEQWNAIKRQIAEAMLLLPPRLREKVLEAVTTGGHDTVLLEEMVGEFQPEQIAVILADYLSREGGAERELGSAASAPNRLIRQLIQSPDHYEVLRPMLADEFKSRGMRLEDHAALFGPFHGEYFARVQGQELAPISSDKLMIFHTTDRAAGELGALEGDWLETMDEAAQEESLAIVHQEILDLESHPVYYRQVVGPQVLETAMRNFKAGRREAARWDLHLLLEHASAGEKEGFAGRREIARELLGRLEPGLLVELFGGVADGDGAEDAPMERLATAGLERVLGCWVERALDPAMDEAKAKRVVAVMARHAEKLAPSLAAWLGAGGAGDSARLWSWLEQAQTNAALPMLRLLCASPSAVLATRAVRFLGEHRCDAGEALLAERARGDDEPARVAEAELSRLASPHAVPLIVRHLAGLDWWGRRHARRLEVIRTLARIATPEARRALLAFMRGSGGFWQRRRLRPLILEAMFHVRRWPLEEARAALDELTRHADRRVARAARDLFLRLEERSEIA